MNMATYAIRRCYTQFFHVHALRLQPGISIGKGAKVIGFPTIRLGRGARLAIGRGAMLNSENYLYHLNMHSPVKLLADCAGARIEIGAHSRLHGVCIHARECVVVGQRCLIAANTQIMDSSGLDMCLEQPERRLDSRGATKPVEIGDDVWIGAGCYVMPGVTIGNGTVVGAGSVVTRSLPPGVFAAGNPATVKIEAGGANDACGAGGRGA